MQLLLKPVLRFVSNFTAQKYAQVSHTHQPPPWVFKKKNYISFKIIQNSVSSDAHLNLSEAVRFGTLRYQFYISDILH